MYSPGKVNGGTNMLRSFAVLAAALGCLALGSAARGADAPGAFIANAVGDASRPAADKARDADRMPAEMLAFAGLAPGARVADVLPGGGYFTRLFARAVGPTGHVYAFVPAEVLKYRATAAESIKALAAEPGYANVSVIEGPVSGFAAPEPLDLVWTSQNYHDLHNQDFGANVAAFNKAVFASLKSGGRYIVLDHAAAAGAPADVTETLHRIDPGVVKQEVLAAGFRLEGESTVLRRTADDHTAKVFDPGIRGKTDQFIFRFRKP
jgi:predicted methyltransferase